MRHLIECFDFYDSLPELIGKSINVETALWFHDFIYEPLKRDNEEQSIIRMRRYLFGYSNYAIENLILATRHNEELKYPPGQLIADVDLWILASPWERFSKYEAQVRQEFRFIIDEKFKEGRIAFLNKLLARDQIYYTPEIKVMLEDKARTNLARSIFNLGK
jgi:predicted metal-dependent HD superfamily phosphohydrolase